MDLVQEKYEGKDKDTLLYVLDVILDYDITKNCHKVGTAEDWAKVPERKTLFGKEGVGLQIGDITSQLFSNYYLTDFDKKVLAYIKGKAKYVRYVDDIVICSNDRDFLEKLKRFIVNELWEINLKISYRKSKILNTSYGIYFLGKIVYPTNTKIQPRILNNINNETNWTLENLNSRNGIFTNFHCEGFLIHHFRKVYLPSYYYNKRKKKFVKKQKWQ